MISLASPYSSKNYLKGLKPKLNLQFEETTQGWGNSNWKISHGFHSICLSICQWKGTPDHAFEIVKQKSEKGNLQTFICIKMPKQLKFEVFRF